MELKTNDRGGGGIEGGLCGNAKKLRSGIRMIPLYCKTKVFITKFENRHKQYKYSDATGTLSG